MLKEKLGLNPIEVRQNVYTPSATALALMRKTGSGYKKHRYDYPYKGPKKVLVICTEDDLLQTANGKYFLTGNHPVEAYVPLLHLESAGFGFDMATPTGKSADGTALVPTASTVATTCRRSRNRTCLPLASNRSGSAPACARRRACRSRDRPRDYPSTVTSHSPRPRVPARSRPIGA